MIGRHAIWKRSFFVSLAAAALFPIAVGAQMPVPAGEEINAKLAVLLEKIRIAEPYSAEEDQIGLDMVETVVMAKGAGITDETIDRMAAIIETADSHMRVFISHALRAMGPKAKRALPALQRAANADEQALQESFSIQGGAPDGATDAERGAIDAIIGPPPL